MSIRTSRRRWGEWKSSVARKNQRRGKERGLSRRSSVVGTVSLTTLEMLGNGWRRLGTWAACGAQETHCDIVDSTLGVLLGLWSLAGFKFLYFKCTAYCSIVIKRSAQCFSWNHLELFQFFLIWKLFPFCCLFYFLVLISTMFCMWQQKHKDFCFCLSVLPVIISLISGNSSAIFSSFKFF